MIRVIFNLISGLCFLSIGISECVIISLHTSNQWDVNDIAMCFLYTMGLMNLFMATTSFYISYQQWKNQTEHYTVTTTTGISIWGLILFFRYPASFFNPFYYKLLMVEMIWFFTRISIAFVLVCGSCLKRDEV